MTDFPFERRRSSRFGYLLKPIIPVRLGGPGRSVNLFMLLDSGADLSMLPYSVGRTLGFQLDMTTRSEVQGIGEGSVPYVLTEAHMHIGDMSITARVGWALIEEMPFILGRLDVFSQLAIEFREFENLIRISNREEG